jgi:hypothetical protein
MSIPHCLVHSPQDTVGVVVIEGLKSGTDMLCLITETDTTFNLKAKADMEPVEARLTDLLIEQKATRADLLAAGELLGLLMAVLVEVIDRMLMRNRPREAS